MIVNHVHRVLDIIYYVYIYGVNNAMTCLD